MSRSVVANLAVKVWYDKSNRTFKLVDEDFKTLLEGYGLYDLNVPLLFEESELDEFVSSGTMPVAHA